MLLDLNDPQKMGLLSLGLRLMSTPGKFGQALGTSGMGALGDMQAIQAQNETRKDRDQARSLRALQEQQAQMALTQAIQEQQRRQKVEQAYSGALMSPATQAMAGGGGPSPQNAQSMQGLMPKMDQSKLIEGLMQADPMMAYQMMQPKAPIKMGAGESLLDPQTMRELYRAPKEETQPSAVKEYQFARSQGYAGTFEQFKKELARAGASSIQNYGSPVAGVDAQGNPVFFQVPEKGVGAPKIVPGVAPPKRESGQLTEGQAKAALFKSQMDAAERELSTVPVDMSKLGSQVDVGMAGGWTNLAASPVAQRARQAQEQWSEAFLRFKTGAATTKDEIALNVRTFFPQPGDGVAVIAQKKRARDQASNDLEIAAGKSTPRPAKPSDSDPLGLR